MVHRLNLNDNDPSHAFSHHLSTGHNRMLSMRLAITSNEEVIMTSLSCSPDVKNLAPRWGLSHRSPIGSVVTYCRKDVLPVRCHGQSSNEQMAILSYVR